MDKAILVIDMPESCIKCPVCASYQASAFSTREVWCATNGKDVEPDSKPDWCPLQPVPDKVEVFMDNWAEGYNACLEDILE